MLRGFALLGEGEQSMKMQLNAQYQQLYEQSLNNYGAGSLSDLFTQRLTDWGNSPPNLFVAPFVILPIFLIGAYVIKSGLLQRMQTDVAVLRKVMYWSFFCRCHIYHQQDGQ
jgi:hypothetical protein